MVRPKPVEELAGVRQEVVKVGGKKFFFQFCPETERLALQYLDPLLSRNCYIIGIVHYTKSDQVEIRGLKRGADGGVQAILQEAVRHILTTKRKSVLAEIR